MRIAALVGKRSDIIRLSLVIRTLDQHAELVLIHTGEETDDSLCDAHFRELELRVPDIRSRMTGADLAAFIGKHQVDRVICTAHNLHPGFFERPTFSFGWKEKGHPHLVSLVDTHVQREIALREGADPKRVLVIGTPTKELLETYADKIEGTDILNGLAARPFDYFVATIHQEESIGSAEKLEGLMQSLGATSERFGKMVFFAVHPRTARQLDLFQLPAPAGVKLLRALSFFDLTKLIRSALAVLTDSVGVQSECCVHRTPVIVLSTKHAVREVAICGASIVTGPDRDNVLRGLEVSLAQPAAWDLPPEYKTRNFSQIVSRIILGELCS